MHQLVYNNKPEHKCSLTLLDPSLLNLDPIQAKGCLSFRGTYPDLYSYLSVLCILCLAVCSDVVPLSILCTVRHLPMHTMQYCEASNTPYPAFCIAYIVFVQFYDHIYQNYIVS